MFEKLYPVLWRGFAVWLVIIFAEFLHGILRVMVLEPFVSDFRARQIAVFSGVVIILTTTAIFVDWMKATNNLQLFAVGFQWLILTLSFEILFGRFVVKASWERIFSDYNLLNGGLLPVGLVILTFAPLIIKKLWKSALFQGKVKV